MKLKRWLFVLCIGLFFALPTFAQTPLPMVLSADCTGAAGKCDVAEFYGLVARTANFMLALVGALLLIMFVYGGFWLIISGGNAERISKAKEVFVGSVIGLILVFGGYTIVNTVLVTVLPSQDQGSDLVNQFKDINKTRDINQAINQAAVDAQVDRIVGDMQGCCEINNSCSQRAQKECPTGLKFVPVGGGGCYNNQCLTLAELNTVNEEVGCCGNQGLQCVDNVKRKDCGIGAYFIKDGICVGLAGFAQCQSR